MTHQNQSNVLEQVLELLRDNGDEGYAQVLELILNQAMLIERSQALGAEPYERSADRRGHANGFKPKAFNLSLIHISEPTRPY